MKSALDGSACHALRPMLNVYPVRNGKNSIGERSAARIACRTATFI